MNCVVCGKEISDVEGRRHAVVVHGQVLGTCSPEHEIEVRQFPEKYLNVLDSCC